MPSKTKSLRVHGYALHLCFNSKNTLMKKLLLFGLAATLVVGACKKDEPEETNNTTTTPKETADTEKPKAVITKPTENQEIILGNSFDVTTTLTDNKELSKYTISLKDPSGKEVGKETGSSSGTSQEIKVSFAPDTSKAEGNYTIGVLAEDKAGNIGDEVKRVVKMKKPTAVMLDKVDPTLTGPTYLEKKLYASANPNLLEMSGTANDDVELADIEFILLDNSSATIHSQKITIDAGKKTYAFTNYRFSIAGNLSAGNYTLKIIVKDKAGNTYEKTDTIQCV